MYKGPSERQIEQADARVESLELISQFLTDEGLDTHYYNGHIEVHRKTIFNNKVYLGLVDMHPDTPTVAMVHSHFHTISGIEVGDNQLVRMDFDLHDPNSLKGIEDHLLEGLTISQWLTLG
jgi:hypothetical protein